MNSHSITRCAWFLRVNFIDQAVNELAMATRCHLFILGKGDEYIRCTFYSDVQYGVLLLSHFFFLFLFLSSYFLYHRQTQTTRDKLVITKFGLGGADA